MWPMASRHIFRYLPESLFNKNGSRTYHFMESAHTFCNCQQGGKCSTRYSGVLFGILTGEKSKCANTIISVNSHKYGRWHGKHNFFPQTSMIDLHRQSQIVTQSFADNVNSGCVQFPWKPWIICSKSGRKNGGKQNCQPMCGKCRQTSNVE